MKKSRIYLMVISVLIICTMAVNLIGCTTKVHAENLMKGITPHEVTKLEDLSQYNGAVTDFAIRLFRQSEEKGTNTLISPLSVLYALAMTGNGAKEETLQQMETVLGMKTEDLNRYLYSYRKNLSQNTKNKLSLANSIWFTDDQRFTVNESFLQTNADYYGADVYKTPFDDQTCEDINNWVNQKTDEMISEILDQLSPSAVMYLVNALAFEAEWSEAYEDHQVRDGIFTKEDGTKQSASMMHGSEGIYLEDDQATGFMKRYQGGEYAFVALLPKEGVSVSEYVESLNGEKLHTMLSNPQYETVLTSIPKFEAESDLEMSQILKTMGMPNAFDAIGADFTGLGTSTEGNICIDRVLHKTFISVGEKGTKAGASTVIEMTDGAMLIPQENKMVYLERPFIYMLIDCDNHIPFFIGTMMDMKN